MKGYSKIKGKTSFIKRSKSNKEFLFLDKDFDDFSTKSGFKKSHFHEQKPSIILGDGSDNNDVEDHVDNYKKKDFFLGKSNNEYDDNHSLKSEGGGGSERTKGVLWRNLSVSSTTTSSYHKNNNIKGNNSNNNNNNTMMMNGSLERQSSTRTIHEVVKRAFSRKRSTSVNSDKYSRIHDQPINGDDDDFENVHDVYNKLHNHTHDDDDDDYVDAVGDDDVGRHNGSLAARSVTMMNKNHHDHDHTTNNNNHNIINNNINNNNNNNNNNNGKKHVGSKVVRACKRLFSR